MAICDSPRFVYTHLLLPHRPYYANAKGDWRSFDELMDIAGAKDDSLYLDYLPKTNQILQDLISGIMNHSKKPTVIILMSDHGYRENNNIQADGIQFRNLLAIHGLDEEFIHIPDSMSNLNVFPMVFDHLFHLGLPGTRDTSINVVDRLDLRAPKTRVNE
jgi:phosphoglycerol transferase MdoB-like AlkP superfamily enzyme